VQDLANRIDSKFIGEIVKGIVKIVVQASEHNLIKSLPTVCWNIAEALASESKRPVKEELRQILVNVIELKFGQNV
jgi:hypothetical protein